MYHRLLLLHIMIYMSCYDSLAQSFRNDTIMVGMMDEISRCHTLMKKDSLLPPYYLSAKIEVKKTIGIAFARGIIKRDTIKNSNGSCELRYGTFDLDHGNYSLKNSGGSYGGLWFSENSDYWDIRESLWRSFEHQYAKYSSLYNQKVQLISTGALKDTIKDFVRSPQILDIYEMEDSSLIIPNHIPELIKDLSQYIKKFATIIQPGLGYKTSYTTSYFYNTEGSKAIVGKKDVPDFIVFTFKYFDIYNTIKHKKIELFLKDDVTQMKATIDHQVQSTIRKDNQLFSSLYSGPVLIEGEAVRDILLHKVFDEEAGLFSVREIYMNDPFQRQIYEKRYNYFQDRNGARAFPKDMDIKVGNQKYVDGVRVPGFKRFDIEGIIPKDSLTLVKSGIIKNLISTRIPTISGNEPHGYTQSKMIDQITAYPPFIHFNFTNEVTQSQLKNQFIEALKDDGLDFGIIIKSISKNENTRLYSSFKKENRIYIDQIFLYEVSSGKEIPIFGVYIKDIQNHILRRIQGSGKDQEISITDLGHRFDPFSVLCKYPKALHLDEMEIIPYKGEEGIKPVVSMPSGEK